MKNYISPETTVLSYTANTIICGSTPVAPEFSSPADVAPGSGDDAV